MGFENPFKKFNKEKAGTAAAVALVGTLGIATGPIPEVIKAFQKDKPVISHQDTTSHEQFVKQQKDGTPVSIDLKQNTITIGAHQPIVEMDLKQPITNIDLHQEEVHMKPPESLN
jgi:hypothetical protein